MFGDSAVNSCTGLSKIHVNQDGLFHVPGIVYVYSSWVKSWSHQAIVYTVSKLAFKGIASDLRQSEAISHLYDISTKPSPY